METTQKPIGAVTPLEADGKRPGNCIGCPRCVFITIDKTSGKASVCCKNPS